MLELFQTDTDAGPESSVGTGQADQVGKSIKDIHANWLLDGHGVRGPQKAYQTEAAYPSQMQLPQDSPPNRSSGAVTATEQCEPSGGDTSKIYVRATHYVDGVWQCYWLVTTTCP